MVGDADCSGVVRLDWSAGLWPTHFIEGLSERNYFFGGGVESSKFGFGGGGHDKFQDLGDRQDGAIVSGERVILGHEDVRAGAAAAFGFVVEANIGVGAEYHVTAAICGAIVREGGEVIKKLADGFGSGFSGSGLLGAQGAESGKKFVVNSSCIVEKGADDALDPFDAFVGERGTVWFVVGDLGDLAVDDFAVFVRG